ncbi:MAG: hypothetical protein DWH81_02225 [Planctomycetota bacterium]|nr:MAG: hypothetical protein DWH81_02225 [Planctomycetota bacterium]
MSYHLWPALAIEGRFCDINSGFATGVSLPVEFYPSRPPDLFMAPYDRISMPFSVEDHQR